MIKKDDLRRLAREMSTRKTEQLKDTSKKHFSSHLACTQILCLRKKKNGVKSSSTLPAFHKKNKKQIKKHVRSYLTSFIAHFSCVRMRMYVCLCVHT